MMMQAIESVEVHPVAWVIIGLAAIVCGLADLRSRRLHTAISLPFFIASLLWALVIGSLLSGGEYVSAAVLFSAPFVLLVLIARLRALGHWFRHHMTVTFGRESGWIRH